MARVRLLMTSLFFFTVVAAAHKAEAQGLRQVNVTIPALTESLVAFYLGKEKGYLREEGLDVELIMVDPSGGDTRRNRQPRAARKSLAHLLSRTGFKDVPTLQRASDFSIT